MLSLAEVSPSSSVSTLTLMVSVRDWSPAAVVNMTETLLTRWTAVVVVARRMLDRSDLGCDSGRRRGGGSGDVGSSRRYRRW